MQSGAAAIVDDLRKVQEIEGCAPRFLQTPGPFGQDLHLSVAFGEEGHDAICFRVILGVEHKAAVADKLGQAQSGAPARISKEREAPMRLAPASTMRTAVA